MNERERQRALEERPVAALADRAPCAPHADEAHYLFFHTIVFDASDWQQEPSVTERAA